MENVKINGSEELVRFIKTVSTEASEDRSDGILGRLVNIAGGEREIYEFIVAEGYHIAYDEFLEYYKACQIGVSVASGELTDDDLDNVSGGWGFSSVKKLAGKAASKVGDAAYDATKYVADNPAAFVAGAGAVGTGLGTATGAVTGAYVGAVIGAALGAGAGAVPGAGLGGTLGAAVGGGVGGAAGAVVGMGTVIIANELTD